jgi:hypothetical protein
MAPKELRPCDIRRIVQERLSGFLVRQAERDAIRAKRRKRPEVLEDRQECFPEFPHRTIGNGKGEPQVKSPVIFRAEFEGPKWTSFSLRGSIAVEIFHAKMGTVNSMGEWRARRPANKTEFKFTPQSRHSTLQQQIKTLEFQTQLTDWEAFDSRQSPPVPLRASDWAVDKDGRVYLTESYLEAEKARNSVTK